MKITQDRVGSPDLSNTGTARTALDAAKGASTEELRSYLEVAAIDGVPGVSRAFIVEARGYNITIDTGTTPETIAQVGGRIVRPPSGAQTFNIASNNGNDTSAGTGARTVNVVGTGATGLWQEEKVTMNGGVPVATAAQFQDIYSLEVTAAGSNGTNVGRISATAATDGTVQASMIANEGRAMSAYFTVPLGYNAHLIRYGAGFTVSGTRVATMVLRHVNVSGVARNEDIFAVTTSGGHQWREASLGTVFFQGATVSLECSSINVSGSGLNAGFDLLLVAR